MSPTDTVTKADLVEDALAFFRASSESDSPQRKREFDDLQFQVPELQWPADVQGTRKSQIVNNVTLPARPMLSIPKLDQPIQLVLNQERAAHLGVQVHALTEDADDDTAEILQGLYRRIEVDSRANLARSWAFERAVKCGRGFYRVLTEYDPSAGDPKDQRIVIKRILEQGRVYLDPFAQEPDWSDGEKALVTDDMRWTTYRRKYPTSKLAAYDTGDFASITEEDADWIQGDDDASRKVRVAEYFYVKGDGADRQVWWCKLNAVEILEGPQQLNGRYIPIVPVIGRELIPFDAQRRWAGIVSNNKDAQRLFNYAASGAVEAAALEPKAPFDLDPREIENYETFWQQANTRNFPYLPRNKFINGTLIPEAKRIQADTSKMSVNAMLLQQAGDFIHAGTGAFEPTLGQESTRAKSGRAILSLQQQHDEGNSNWLDNLAEISMTLEAKIVLDLIPAVYDRPGRVARILDLEDNPQTVMLNAPFVMNPETKRPQQVPPQMARPMAQAPPQGPMMGGPMGQPMPGGPMGQPQGAPAPPQPDVKHYDLTKGRYGVSVSVGKAYKSRVEQGQDQLGQLFQAEPQLFQILGDLYLKFADFPGHMEAAERVKKMLPPQLQDQNDPQGAAQQIPQLKAQLQAMGQQLQQAVEFVKTEQAKHQAQVQIATIKGQTDESIARINNAAKIEVARISAAKEAINQDAAAKEERLATGLQLAHDAEQAEQDRAHEVGLAALDHAHTMQQGQQQQAHDAASSAADAGASAEQSAQDHAQGLEAADQAHGQNLEAMAAQPQPESGA